MSLINYRINNSLLQSIQLFCQCLYAEHGLKNRTEFQKCLKKSVKSKKWSSIAKIMDFQFNLAGRNGKQCRERYKNHLDNQIVQNKFSYEDQKLLEELHHKIGNKWSVIANHFKGRTGNFLKNQMYSKLRKSIRKLNKFIKDQPNKKSMKQFKLTLAFKIVQTNDFKICQSKQHNPGDLDFYQEIKKKMLQYAQEESNYPKQLQQMASSFQKHSKNLIQQLGIFEKKFTTLQKNKRRNNSKNYVNEDEIIINSLSNNPPHENNIEREDQMQHQSMSQSEVQSAFKVLNKIDSTQAPHLNNEPELRMISSRIFDTQKSKEEIQKQFQISPCKKQQKNEKGFHEVDRFIDKNQKIVKEVNIAQPFREQPFLQQSQNRQFLNLEYIDNLKSYSYIDESLFH